MKEKTFRFVHILYVLLISNIISICYLAIGLFALTIVPVVFTNIEISIMLFNDEIDGYSGFIFTNRVGYIHNPQTINRAIKRIIRDYNKEEKEIAKIEKRKPLEIRDFSVHSLRHTFCTRFCENETNLKVIQEIMGHSDITTTMNIYAEATNDKKQEAFSQLEGKIKIC